MSALGTLEDGFREKIVTLLDSAEQKTGYKWIVTSGRRTMSEQKKLYDQGRTSSGPVVTKAPPGSSAHNFGLAADLAPMKEGKIWWEAPKSVWRQMADCAQSMGLVAGYYFKTIFDAPHVEDKAWRTVQAKWKAGEIQVA